MDNYLIQDTEKRNRVKFFAYIIPEFARSYKMDKQEAYQYLKKYGGLNFLFENWWALHTDNSLYVVRDMFDVCSQNGGDMK
jgi:hypothetical protein